MVRDEEIERIAIEEATKYETSRGWEVESVEADNRGFDLISRKPHPHDPKTFTDVRFIEVKGRVAIGEVALSFNEYKTAERLKQDYWLYAVFNCGSKPELHAVQDPARLGWEPIVKIDHYHTSAARSSVAQQGNEGQEREHPQERKIFLEEVLIAYPSDSSKSIYQSSESPRTLVAKRAFGMGIYPRCISGGLGVRSRPAGPSSARRFGPTRLIRSALRSFGIRPHS